MSFYVSDEFRVNPLSLTDGGFDVKIFFKKGPPRIYSRVKDPISFFKGAREQNSNVRFFRIV